MGKGTDKNINYDEQDVALGKQDMRAAWPRDKLEFKFFKPYVIFKQAFSVLSEMYINIPEKPHFV